MTATACVIATLLLVWVAALTPLRADEIAALDGEAAALAREWAAADQDADEADRLLRASNEAFAAARDREPPLHPLEALGGALLTTAVAVALWPRSDGGAPAQDAPTER